MDAIFDLFTKKEIMIVGIILGVLLVMVLIITLVDFLSRRKKENKELEDAFNNFDNVDIEPVKLSNLNINNSFDSKIVEKHIEKEELVNEFEEEKENKNVNNNIEVNYNEIKLELDENKVDEKKEINLNKVNYVEPLILDIDEPIIQEVKEEFIVEEKEVLQEINVKNEAKIQLEKIEEELNNPKSLEDTLYDLQVEEEENAVISYQELLEKTSELNIVNTDSGDEIISLKEIYNMYDNSKEENNVLAEMTNVSIDDAYKGEFTSTPLLSPVMGVEGDKILIEEIDDNNFDANSLAQIQLENTANLEKLDKELRKTNEFLSILNDLKKNLD